MNPSLTTPLPAPLPPGQLRVLAMDLEAQGVAHREDGKVVFHKITILQDSIDGVWVTGLPAQTDIIVLGQEYVAQGQQVDATRVE